MPGMRALAVLALLAVAVPGATAAAPPTARLTFSTWLTYGAGTGALGSPAAFCEANADGTSITRVSDAIGRLSDPAWTPDGSTFAFVEGDAVRVTSAARWAPRTVASGGWPAWSPDGRRLAYASDGIRDANADGSGARLVTPAAASSPSWSPDGTRIAYAADGIWTVRADGTDRAKLTDDGSTPTWSPDGSRIAFVAQRPGGTAPLLVEQELYAIPAGGGARTQVSTLVPTDTGPVETGLGRPAWSPDGSSIAVTRTRALKGAKGDGFVNAELLLVDAGSGAETTVLSLAGLGGPAWHAAAPPADAGRPCTIHGDGKQRTLTGTAYADLILGSDTAETIRGGAGGDWIHAGRGRDTVVGGPGADEIWSGFGSDVLDVRDGARDLVHCGEWRSDTGLADRRDRLLGSCRRVTRR